LDRFNQPMVSFSVENAIVFELGGDADFGDFNFVLCKAEMKKTAKQTDKGGAFHRKRGGIINMSTINMSMLMKDEARFFINAIHVERALETPSGKTTFTPVNAKS
jgi:hypothetical protein